MTFLDKNLNLNTDCKTRSCGVNMATFDNCILDLTAYDRPESPALRGPMELMRLISRLPLNQYVQFSVEEGDPDQEEEEAEEYVGMCLFEKPPSDGWPGEFPHPDHKWEDKCICGVSADPHDLETFTRLCIMALSSRATADSPPATD